MGLVNLFLVERGHDERTLAHASSGQLFPKQPRPGPQRTLYRHRGDRPMAHHWHGHLRRSPVVVRAPIDAALFVADLILGDAGVAARLTVDAVRLLDFGGWFVA